MARHVDSVWGWLEPYVLGPAVLFVLWVLPAGVAVGIMLLLSGCCPICWAPVQLTDRGVEVYHRNVPWPEWMDAEHWEQRAKPGHCKCGNPLGNYIRLNAAEGRCPSCERVMPIEFDPNWKELGVKE